jgi:hypothetical protein
VHLDGSIGVPALDSPDSGHHSIETMTEFEGQLYAREWSLPFTSVC